MRGAPPASLPQPAAAGTGWLVVTRVKVSHVSISPQLMEHQDTVGTKSTTTHMCHFFCFCLFCFPYFSRVVVGTKSTTAFLTFLLFYCHMFLYIFEGSGSKLASLQFVLAGWCLQKVARNLSLCHPPSPPPVTNYSTAQLMQPYLVF